MPLQFYGGELLFEPTGKLAMNAACCCGGPCAVCLDKIKGVVFDIAGFAGAVDGSGNPLDCCSDDDGDGVYTDCCWCTHLNGSWFVPWDEDIPANACQSSKIWDLGTYTCNGTSHVLEVIISYTISVSGGALWISANLDVGYTGTSVGCGEPFSVNCSIAVVDPFNITCVGKTCTDSTITGTTCDTSGASVKMTIV